jgi:hypothetical protein
VITDDVLATYARLGGDLNGWQRLRSAGDASIGPALYRLAELLQQAGLVARGLCDQSFEARVRAAVQRETASPEIAARIWVLAGQASPLSERSRTSVTKSSEDIGNTFQRCGAERRRVRARSPY